MAFSILLENKKASAYKRGGLFIFYSIFYAVAITSPLQSAW